VREHRATEDRALNVGPCPNLGGPVHGASRLVEHRPETRHMGRADRFEAELFLAPPLHADAMTRDLHRDNRSIQSRIIGTVVAIAARTVGVPHCDLLALQAQNVGNTVAQRVDALGMRPYGQVPVAVFRQSTGWRQGRMSDEGPRVGLADNNTKIRRRAGVAKMPVVGRLIVEPRGFLLDGSEDPHSGPACIRGSGGCGALDDRFIRSYQRHEVAGAHDPDLAARGLADCRLVQIRQPGTARRLAQHARMQHVRPDDIVDERGTGHLRDQVTPRHRLSDNSVRRRRLRYRRTHDLVGKILRPGKAPVVVAGRVAVQQEHAVLNGQVVGGTIQSLRQAAQHPGSQFGADQANRPARHFDRLAGTG
jgi:hypothetical protein